MSALKHSELTGADIHEPKGYAALTADADVGKIYVANGAGSGTFQYYNTTFVDLYIPDIDIASSAWVCSPVAGDITKIWYIVSTVNAAVTGTGIITPELGGTAITDGAITINTAIEGKETYSATPTALNTVAVGDAIELVSDGGLSCPLICPLYIILEIMRV